MPTTRFRDGRHNQLPAVTIFLATIERSAGERSAGELSAGELSAGELSAGELSGGSQPAPFGRELDRTPNGSLP
jgi:hypothetical protein